MSSYKRKISAKNVRLTEHSMALNDHIYVNEEKFDEVYLDDKKVSMQEKVDKLEQEMMEGLEQKKQAFIDKGYEEGKKIAVQEAEQRIQQNIMHILEQANQLFAEANAYKKKILEEAEAIKIQAFAEQKEDFLELIAMTTKRLIQNELPVESIQMDKIYEEAVKKITYETRRVFVKVHPVMKTWVEQRTFDSDDARVEFLYDVNIMPGDLFIETDKEYIDASIVRKLDNLKNKMRSVIDDSI